MRVIVICSGIGGDGIYKKGKEIVYYCVYIVYNVDTIVRSFAYGKI